MIKLNRDLEFCWDTRSNNQYNWNRVFRAVAGIFPSIFKPHCMSLLCHHHILESLCYWWESLLDKSAPAVMQLLKNSDKQSRKTDTESFPDLVTENHSECRLFSRILPIAIILLLSYHIKWKKSATIFIYLSFYFL